MSGYPSLTLRSHSVPQSSVDSFVKPTENARDWFGSLFIKVQQTIIDPGIFGSKQDTQEKLGPIVCGAWHPSITDQIAFGMSDGVVQVIVQPSTKPVLLRHQHQKKISCLAWQPNSMKSLTVASSAGIFLWEVISQKGSSMPSRTTLYSTSSPVTSLSYTPDGRLCLATTTSNLLLLDCVTGESPLCLRSVSYPGFVVMSPEFCFSFLADGNRFHILRGITEGSETFTRLQSPVKCAVWSPTASHLLFSLAQSHCVLVLEMFNPREVNSKISSQSQILIDLHKTLAYEEGENWQIEDLSMDGTGQKLAILARDSVTSISKVFVFGLTLQTNSVFESDVICENMSPNCVLYQSNPRKGALLCVCCEDGTVNFIPDTTFVS